MILEKVIERKKSNLDNPDLFDLQEWEEEWEKL